MDEVMALCSSKNTNEVTVEQTGPTKLSNLGPGSTMSQNDRDKITEVTRRMNAEGLRVLVVAYPPSAILYFILSFTFVDIAV